MMKRLEHILFIASFITFSWLAMQAVHELGHVLGAWITGGKVIKVAIHPFIFSQTDLSFNPNPLIVVWAGPIIGSMIPLTVFFIARTFRLSCIYLFRFFAGFCLIANGIYIALGPNNGFSDTGIMILHGSARWMLLLFGALTIPLGFYLWHGQGKHFGLGEAKGVVERKAIYASVSLAMVTIVIELIINSR